MAYLELNGQQAADDICVLSFDADRQHMLKPSCALRYFQEISDQHCAFYGCGHDELLRQNAVFLLVNVSMNIKRMPLFRENLKVVTWHRGRQTGVQFLRDNILIDANGDTVVECAASWILVNPDTHRILRHNDMPAHMVPKKENGYIDNVRLGKIDTPKDMPLSGMRRIAYSDIDYNGHLNNCVYANFVMDSMPVPLDGKFVSKLDIYFCSEAVEGENLSVYAQQAGDWIYFRGEHARGKCFDARCELKDIK